MTDSSIATVRLRWVSMAPFGKPVVPLVYSSHAVPSSSMSRGGSSVEAAPTTSRYGGWVVVTVVPSSITTMCSTVGASPSTASTCSRNLAWTSRTLASALFRIHAHSLGCRR